MTQPHASTPHRFQTPRRLLRWEKVRGPRAILAIATGTALGAGLVPLAPGTAGTLAALPLAYFTNEWPWPLRIALWTALTAAGTWAAKVFDELMGTSDNQNIVMDEVVGLGITAWTAGHDVTSLLVAFVLFRFFDILKPFPVRNIDTWSKKKASENTPLSQWYGGFGVMADDLVAGLQGLCCMLLLQWLHILPS
ncbi:phosphatidylglycerophosphatase A [Bdellovibrionota bacterium FG-1]